MEHSIGFHAWYDPLKRVAKKAGQEQVSLSTPLVGEVFKIQVPPLIKRGGKIDRMKGALLSFHPE